MMPWTLDLIDWPARRFSKYEGITFSPNNGKHALRYAHLDLQLQAGNMQSHEILCETGHAHAFFASR